MGRKISEHFAVDGKGKCEIHLDRKDEMFYIKYFDDRDHMFYIEEFPNQSYNYVESAADDWTMGLRTIEEQYAN